MRTFESSNERSRVHADRQAKAIVIRTLSFRAGNYGGILQAYALQQVLLEFSPHVAVDTSDPQISLMRGVRFSYRMLRGVLPAWVDWQWRSREEVNRRLDDFISENIAISANFARTNSRNIGVVAGRIRAVVVGSDQVWRSAYSNIPNSFLAFLEGANIRRLSYAASFGTDSIQDYSQDDRESARRLLGHFDGVSVREDSGVAICREEFDVEAERHLDPTMLLPTEQYLSLASSRTPRSAAAGGLLLYVLDTSETVDSIADEISAALNVDRRSLLPPKPESYRQFHGNVGRYLKPPVEEWILSFASASFVITDSFHGCVFAILFHRPFIVVGNRARGYARFESLLALFGLEHHLISTFKGRIDPRIFSPDWEAVDMILEQERQKAMAYLRHHLADI
jgi:hypothetical protein